MNRITIGIPSFNEEQNIINLLRSISMCCLKEFTITEVIISDDSLDNTPRLVDSYAKQSTLKIILLHHPHRRGVASAWNEIFEQATGDILILYDADVILADNSIYELASSVRGTVGLCASNPEPVNKTGLVGRASMFISRWLRLMRINGLSQYTVMGRALSINSDVAKKIKIPSDIIAVDLYLQCRVLEQKLEVIYNDNAVVYFIPPRSILDFSSQVIRGVNGHKQIQSYVSDFKINLSPSVVFNKTIENITIDPFGALSVLLCYLLIPFYRFQLPEVNSVKWHIARSTKAIDSDTSRSFDFSL
jgi:glycosyltransferase involved in cell wall biosynthesis